MLKVAEAEKVVAAIDTSDPVPVARFIAKVNVLHFYHAILGQLKTKLGI